VFFTGAGISLAPPSNLIMFNQLQNEIIWALHQNLPEGLKQTYDVIYDEIRNKGKKSETANKFLNIPPEYIFELCKKGMLYENGTDAHYELKPLNAFRDAKPNLNHLHLTRFLLTGYTPAIFTTNFDLLIESGIDRLSRNINNCIRVNKRWRGEHFKNEEYSAGQYFKLHGCIEDPESIIVSLNDIGKRCTNQLPALKHYLENYHVFFAGYRGADLDIFIHLATIQCKGIIWNGYTEDAIIPKVRYLLEKQKATVIVGDVSDILNEISSNIGLSQFSLDETQKYPKIDFLNEFNLWANKIEPISIITILGDLWEYIGEWDKALIFFRSGYNLTQKYYDKHTENVLLSRLASLFYKKKEYEKVRKYCNLALKNAKDFPAPLQLYEYVNTLQLLGLVDAHKDLIESLTLYQRALDYQEQLEQIHPQTRRGKADILLNVAVNFKRARRFDDSVKYCKSALEIYDEFGDVQGRASSLACIGSILLEQEKQNECLVYYKEAEYLFNETGNIYKLSRLCHDMARIYFKNNNRTEAKRYAEMSLVYYETISDQEECDKARELLNLINHSN